MILLFLATRTPPDRVDRTTGQPVLSPCMQPLLQQAPAFKDFLLACLSAERGAASAEKLLAHSFLKEPLTVQPTPATNANGFESGGSFFPLRISFWHTTG